MKDLNSTTPAAPGGYKNITWQADVNGHVSGYFHVSGMHVVAVAIDGGASTPSTPIFRWVQVPYAGTIVGWAVVNVDAAGSLTCEISKKAGSAPPAAPSVPNVVTDKISASAPATLTAAQSSSGGASAISTWTSLAVAQWDAIGFNITAATTLHTASVQLYIQE